MGLFIVINRHVPVARSGPSSRVKKRIEGRDLFAKIHTSGLQRCTRFHLMKPQMSFQNPRHEAVSPSGSSRACIVSYCSSMRGSQERPIPTYVTPAVCSEEVWHSPKFEDL